MGSVSFFTFSLHRLFSTKICQPVANRSPSFLENVGEVTATSLENQGDAGGPREGPGGPREGSGMDFQVPGRIPAEFRLKMWSKSAKKCAGKRSFRRSMGSWSGSRAQGDIARLNHRVPDPGRRRPTPGPEAFTTNFRPIFDQI